MVITQESWSARVKKKLGVEFMDLKVLNKEEVINFNIIYQCTHNSFDIIDKC